jgi:hypothetical protein
MARPDYPMLRPNGSSPATENALVTNNAMAGRLNAVRDIAIMDGADMVVVQDDTIHPYQMLLTEPGSSVTGHTIAGSTLMLSVTPGPARMERICLLG